MSTHLKFCGCQACREVRHGSKAARKLTNKTLKGARRKWNRLAREGRDEEITPVGVPYSA